MRKEPIDNYSNISLLGNNIYDMIFVNYLFQSQNVHCSYYEKYIIDDKIKENILKNIAYYFGTREPFLINDKDLKRIFLYNGIPTKTSFPNLDSNDIINQINMCLKSDVVYVCNSNGKLDKYTMFILGYLMAMEQEIFFWNDIDPSEWLLACILKKNNKGYKEIVHFPLDIVRLLAYPYLFKNINMNLPSGQYGELVINDNGSAGVSRNTEFSLSVKDQKGIKNTISLLGSLNKHLPYIKENFVQFKNSGYQILAPSISNIKTGENGFVIFEDDISDNPNTIESDFIEKCLKSEKIVVCDKDGYIGNTVMLEIGYLLAKSKNIEFLQEPNEKWLVDVINYFLNLGEKKTLEKCRND